MAIAENWKELGVHHKTAEKLENLKLSPDKAKEVSDDDLKEKYGLNDETVAKIRSAVSGTPPVKETAAKKVETAAEPKAAKKPKRVAQSTSDEDERPQTLEEKLARVAKIIEKSAGLIKLGSDPDIQYGKRSTGFTALDMILSDGETQGGFPVGKPVLIAGGPQTCKTALAMAHVARTMKDDPAALCLWADAENSFDPVWASKQGIDLKRLIVVPSMIADDMVSEIERVLNEVPVSNVTVDSVGSLLSWQEVMKDRDDDHYTKEVSADTMALTARFMSKLCRRWIPWIHRNKMTLTFITHVYAVIGSYSGAEEIKGGKGLQHSVHLTIWTSRRKGDQEQKQKIKMPDGRVVDLFTAYEAVFTVQKTRQSPTEGQKVAIPFVYGKGLSETESVIEMAFSMGVIQTKGSWYTHPSFALVLNGAQNNWINGYDVTVKFIRENEQVFDAILKGVGAAIAADDAAPEAEKDDGDQQ